jgi:hypothetical protein
MLFYVNGSSSSRASVYLSTANSPTHTFRTHNRSTVMFVNKSIPVAALLLSLGLLPSRAQTTIAFDDGATIAIATSTVHGDSYDGEGATSVFAGSSTEATSTIIRSDGEDDDYITSSISPFAEGTTSADGIGGFVTSSFDGPIASLRTSGKRKRDSHDQEQI